MEIFDQLLQSGMLELGLVALGAPAGIVAGIRILKQVRKK